MTTWRFTALAVRVALLTASICALPGGATWAVPPKVIKAEPDHGDRSVDPALSQIRIEFDQDMEQGGFSICGGQGMEITGEPTWTSARVFELPVKLKPGQRVQISLNCPSAQNFKNTDAEPAAIYPITFTTLKPGAKPPSGIPLATKRKAISRLRAAIDDHYSYRERRNVDWNARFAEFTPQLEKSKNWAEFAKLSATLLSAAEDPHIWLTLDGETIGTYTRQVERNYSPDQLKRLVPGWKLHNRMVATGRFDDGIGYVLIATLSPRSKDELAPAIAALKEFADAPGIILDVRANGGGNELLAREIAGCFLREKAVYARNSNRDPAAPGGFTKVFDRVVEPCEPAVRAPVAVLMGPANMSSCESLLMMMDQAPTATLIGGPSYGSSGNPKPYELAEGLVVFLPSWKDMRADGASHEGHPLTPDVAVETNPADFTSGDPVLERALLHLRQTRSDR